MEQFPTNAKYSISFVALSERWVLSEFDGQRWWPVSSWDTEACAKQHLKSLTTPVPPRFYDATGTLIEG